MIRQIIPPHYCLKCKGCCRFKEADSAWVPCLLHEEVQLLLGKAIPPAAISKGKRLLAVPGEDRQGFVCPFLSTPDNTCKIYSFRPFECQLYPFLLNARGKKIILTVDLNCPWVQENLKSKECKEYTDYLAAFLNSPSQLKMLKDNPHLLVAYEEVAELVELHLSE